jgi:lipopolysaccharide/colanic/teichoic acid biosynthesis glycosyltransferase
VKRFVDLVMACALLLVSFPLMVCVACAVWVKLGSPVLFRQERAGRDGLPFTIAKFRSMSDARDARGALLSDDERLGVFGSRLRSTSLDELPQLWSIARGDMSFVGPRPLPVQYVPRYSGRQRRRLDVPPGLTGWAQIHGRNSLAWPERLELDVWYVENWSLRLDVRILLRTAGVVLSRRGVGADGVATMTEFRGET